MSNDNKTLADVQPGGRVRLGDQAERAKFEAWVKNHVSSLARAADGDYASNFTHALWSAWQAALSAQPSPGGQDARAQFEEYRGGDCERDAQGYYTNPRTAQDWALWQAALSAQSSPGGQGELAALVSKWRNEASAYDDQQAKETGYEVDWTYDAKARALDRAADELESALAARQPVRHVRLPQSDLDLINETAARQPVGEPVAWMHTHKATGRVKFGLSPMYDCDFNAAQWDSVALYAAPAQAVDLGQFREAVEAQYSGAMEQWCGDEAEERYLAARRDRLLALIDSQAVGNG
ncbi:hypothetical protein [Stenotrophomonas pavanii]|uniref:hypothetical protein n=1 Tax=Stenotrophomonas pavanii TaxID=487698 RepID=UPI0039C6477B